MLERVRLIVSKLFGQAPETVTEGSSPDTISTWDSMTHMNLIIALEDEFGVEFSDDEIPRLTTVALILDALRSKGQ